MTPAPIVSRTNTGLKPAVGIASAAVSNGSTSVVISSGVMRPLESSSSTAGMWGRTLARAERKWMHLRCLVPRRSRVTRG